MIQKRKISRPQAAPRQPAPKQPPVTSRQWCFELLETWRESQQLVRDQLQLVKTKDKDSETHQGVNWAERLIIRQRTVDRVLKECVSRPKENVQAPLWTLLQMGAAELLFGPTDAQYAAISETVELCRYAGHPEWTGFLNGVLRGVQRLMTEKNADEAPLQPSARTYPVAQGEYRSLNQKVFPNPAQKLGEYLAIAFSLPDAMAREWTRRYSVEECYQLAWSTIETPLMAVRINRLAIMPEEWLAKCEAAGIAVAPTEFQETIRLLQKVRISELPGFAEGEFVIQDSTAQHAARMLNPYPKQRVLDLCAGPGTKTTQLAELMLDQGEVLATEVVQHRLDQVQENADRLGFQSIQTHWIDREEPHIPGEPFDAILVDAPCSNTGVLGKRAEARWRYSINELHALNELQARLLDYASTLLAEEGRLVYSTCSIEPKENEQFVVRWLERHPDFHCLKMQTILPNRDHDGGFCALLERREQEEESTEEAAEEQGESQLERA